VARKRTQNTRGACRFFSDQMCGELVVESHPCQLVETVVEQEKPLDRPLKSRAGKNAVAVKIECRSGAAVALVKAL